MDSHNNIYYPIENDSHVVKALLGNRIWEKKIDSIMKEIIKPDWICLDCGAYIGSHSITMAEIAKECHSFEPQPLVYQCLLKTRKKKELKNWYINNFALTNKDDGSVDFSTNNDGDARITRSNMRKNWKYQIKVKSLKLDSLNFKKVDFMKIDVEGSEFELLEGAKETISKCRPIIIMEVFKGKKNKELLDEFCEKYQYVLESINSENYLLKPIKYK